MFEFIKQYYYMKLYIDEDIKVFVKAKWITEEQFKEITKIDYAK